jgi:hypothetical protein
MLLKRRIAEIRFSLVTLDYVSGDSRRIRFAALRHIRSCLSPRALAIKSADLSMSKIIFRLLFAVSIAGATAFTTIYVFAEETPAVIAEIFSCMLAAMICANYE